MSIRSFLVCVTVCLVALPSAAPAQSYGDGFGIGGVLLPSGAGTLLAKTRVGSSLGLEFALALSTYSSKGTSSSDFSIGVGALQHWNTDSQLQPYLGARFDITNSPYKLGGTDESDTSFGLFGALGAEYFVTKKLSLEGEAALGLHFGSFSMSTGTRLAALLYF
jgi:opacity protein-like surface antigen